MSGYDRETNNFVMPTQPQVENYWNPLPGYRILRVGVPVEGEIYVSGDGKIVFVYRINDGNQNGPGILGPRVILEKIELPPPPKYVPFTFEDFKMFWGKPINHRGYTEILSMNRANECRVYLISGSVDYSEFVDKYVFADTLTPCGKLNDQNPTTID